MLKNMSTKVFSNMAVYSEGDDDQDIGSDQNDDDKTIIFDTTVPETIPDWLPANQ
ncbi:hypothetical protein Mapa_008925 [Marchantia paleacea]|nr:hypothetical protein Mapa_008925 [Marchantia paleacea]